MATAPTSRLASLSVISTVPASASITSASEAGVSGGFGQGRIARKLRRVGVVDPGLARVVPEREDAAHHHVRAPVRPLIHIAAEEQQVDDSPVHLDGAFPGVVVDGPDVVYALVLVVDVVQLVVLAQLVAEGGDGLGELLLALGVAEHGGHRVEQLQELGLVALLPGAGAVRPARRPRRVRLRGAAGECEQQGGEQQPPPPAAGVCAWGTWFTRSY